MSDMKKATRESYGEALLELAEQYSDFVVLDADLAAATKTGMFKKKYPNRFIDCGIAECNMLGVAAGIATTGIKVYASSFAMFAAGRAFEVARNAIGYPHLSVNICATHAGISVGEDGATHQCCEDIALMRTIPGMTVISPADDIEAKAAIKALINYDGPAYVRLGRLAVPVFCDEIENYKFEIGKGVQIFDGEDVTIIATGLMVNEAMLAAKELEALGISTRVINIHTIKPIDKNIILKAAKETKVIITVEEHSVIGGLGSAVAEVCSENLPTVIKRIGVNDVFGSSGPAAELLIKYGLCADNIVTTARNILKQ